MPPRFAASFTQRLSYSLGDQGNLQPSQIRVAFDPPDIDQILANRKAMIVIETSKPISTILILMPRAAALNNPGGDRAASGIKLAGSEEGSPLPRSRSRCE